MSTQGSPEPGNVAPHAEVARADVPHDAAHLDADAKCLEDPVHCGDAEHQHAVHARGSRTGDGQPA
jgi:hypothetical protein